MKQILFLDDDHERHHTFRARTKALGYHDRFQIVQVFTSADAIQHLRDRAGTIEQVFLDHDLSCDDVGMKVVDHICTMQTPPPIVTVHSVNDVRSVEMCTRLAELRTILVQRVPFPQLIEQMR